MKIAVNTRLLIENKLDGIGWFTYYTLKYITQNNPQHQFYFLFDRKYSEKFIFSDNIEPVVVPPPTRHPFLWEIWLKYSLPKALDKIKPDIFVSPDGFLPYSVNIPSLTVIHDINFVHRPQDLPFLTAKFYQKRFKQFALNATHIATVSEYSKNDIVNTYKISPNKVSVVYNGAAESYKPLDKESIKAVREKYTDGHPYFLFVGSLHPRKNLKGLIQAFDIFKEKSNSTFKLLIVGPAFFKNKEMLTIYDKLKHKKDIIFTGHRNQEELTRITASAFSSVLVSFFEGFGIPVLEAMYCDVPVIVSNVTSLPEVAGDAALYANPSDIQEIANAMLKMYEDETLRNELIEKGRIQRQKFSWQKTAEKLWQCVELLKK